MADDVKVIILDQTTPTTQKGFGLPLILGVVADKPYKVYGSLTELAADYVSTTDEYKIAQAIWAQNPAPSQIAVYSFARGIPVTGDLAAKLDQLIVDHNDWYWLLFAPRVQEDGDIKALSDWVLAHDKLLVCTNEAGTADAIVAQVQTLMPTLNSERTVFFAHTAPEEYPDGRLVGKLAPLGVGTYTWKFKNLQGLSEAGFLPSQVTQLHTVKAITYKRRFGVLVTTEGWASDGSYVDNCQAKDWIIARMEEAIGRRLITLPKIPYDDAGIAILANEMTAVLQQATNQGMIARLPNDQGAFEVTVPARADIPDADVAARTLNGLKFRFVIAGAIHNVEVEGIMMLDISSFLPPAPAPVEETT